MSLKISDVEKFTTAILNEVVVKLAVESLAITYPILQVPIIKSIFSYFAEKVCIAVYGEAFRMGAYFYIGIKDDIDLKKYNDTLKDFKEVVQKTIDTPTTDNTKEIEDAKIKLKDKLATLVKFKR